MARVTVLLPVYNAEQHLAACLRSVLEQEFRDFFVLVLDDGSTDRSRAIAAQLADERVVIESSPVNLGLGATLERGLALCTTELFARMDADDISHPHRFSKQVAFFDKHPELGMVGTQFRYIGASGRRLPSPAVPASHDAIAEGLLRGDLSIVHGSIMARTEIVRGAGGYRVTGMGEDWDMFLRVAERTRLANLEDELYSWRLHPVNSRPPHLARQQTGIRFARANALLRLSGRPEMSWAAFIEVERLHSPLRHAAANLDAMALGRYRRGLARWSERQWFRGSLDLLAASLLSPRRAARRLCRNALSAPRKSS